MTDQTPRRRTLYQRYNTELTSSVVNEIIPWKNCKLHVSVNPTFPLIYRDGTPILSGWVSFVICDVYMGQFVEESYALDGKLDIGLVSSNLNLDMLAMTRDTEFDCEISLLEQQGQVFKNEITVFNKNKKAVAHAIGTYHAFRV